MSLHKHKHVQSVNAFANCAEVFHLKTCGSNTFHTKTCKNANVDCTKVFCFTMC